jgi:hypothetical protein
MVVAEKKPFKVEIDGDVVEATRAAFDRKKIGYWDGTEAVLRWFSSQDGMLQSLILGQVDEKYRQQVARMVLEQMAAGSGAEGDGPKRKLRITPSKGIAAKESKDQD